MRRLILVSLSVLIVTSMLMAGCLPTPTPTPKPTDTPAPTETPAPEPTPTEEPKPTPTEEPTAEPTEAIVETPVITETVEVTEPITETEIVTETEVLTTTETITGTAPATVRATPTAATPSTRQTPAATPTKAAAAADEKTLKVGLITDVGGVNDKSFNQSAWAGVQKAMEELNVEGKFIESKQPTDYEKNIDQFATEGYDVIITVGFLMGDATEVKAQQYPDVKFAIIDHAYFPEEEGDPDPYESDLKNVTSLMFQEDEVGFLAGVVAAGMSKTGTVCSVAGIDVPPVVRFVTGYQTGAKWMNEDIETLNVYIPSFTDPAKGKEVGESMIKQQDCDVVFGVGGNTGNGGLLAAKEQGVMAIGVDVDQYYTYPEVQDALLTSAAKNVDVAVYEYLKSVVKGTDKAGIVTANLKNGGIGLAPYHDWEDKIPEAVKKKVEEATKGLIDGTIETGYTS